MKGNVTYRVPRMADWWDEVLVWFAQDGRPEEAREAADTLTDRYFEEARDVVALLGGAAGLQPADVADAQQETFFVIGRAVQRCDFRRYRGPDQRLFRTFLHKLLQDHVRKFRARCRDDRLRGNGVLRAYGQALAVSTPRAAVHWLDHSPDWDDEPSLLVEEWEARADLGRVVEGLPAGQRQAWEDALAGTRPGVLARQRGCSVYAVRRQRRRAVDQVCAALGGHRG